MGRSYITPKLQPDDLTCGPTAVKHALEVFGIRKSVAALREICHTNRNGTSTKNIIAGFCKMGFSVLAVERANLRHVQSVLRNKPNHLCAALVTYLYDLNDNEQPHMDSGHWALVGSYSASSGKIILLDSATAQKKSYYWMDFRNRWKDFDFTRKKNADGSVAVRRHWQRQLLLVVAQDESHLPRFTIKTQKKYTP